MDIINQRFYRLAIARKLLTPPTYAELQRMPDADAEKLLRGIFPHYAEMRAYQEKGRKEPATPSQRAEINNAIDAGHMEALPEKTWEMLSKADAAMVIAIVHATIPPQPASESQLREIADLRRSGHVPAIPPEKWYALTNDEATKCIGIGRYHEANDIIVPNADYGFRDDSSKFATASQIHEVKNLIGYGRLGIALEEVDNFTRREAGHALVIGRARDRGNEFGTKSDTYLVKNLMRPIPPTPAR